MFLHSVPTRWLHPLRRLCGYPLWTCRLENRKQYYEKGERVKRTHELFNISSTVESLAPVFKGLSKQEMYELLETVFSLPEVQHTLRSFENRKGEAEHGHSRPE